MYFSQCRIQFFIRTIRNQLGNISIATMPTRCHETVINQSIQRDTSKKTKLIYTASRHPCPLPLRHLANTSVVGTYSTRRPTNKRQHFCAWIITTALPSQAKPTFHFLECKLFLFAITAHPVMSHRDRSTMTTTVHRPSIARSANQHIPPWAASVVFH